MRSPAAPTVMALPAKGESFAVFQQHDTTCRAYASAQTGGTAKRGIAGAVLGSGLGAAAGALLGSASGHAGGGAAIGAGTGLVAGSLLGGASARHAAAAAQQRYNIGYTQCMIASGEHIVPPAPLPTPVVYAAPPIVYVPTPAYAVSPPY
jgi:Glycine-zipper domain